MRPSSVACLIVRSFLRSFVPLFVWLLVCLCVSMFVHMPGPMGGSQARTKRSPGRPEIENFRNRYISVQRVCKQIYCFERLLFWGPREDTPGLHMPGPMGVPLAQTKRSQGRIPK